MIHLAGNQLQHSRVVEGRGAFSSVFPFLDLQMEGAGLGEGCMFSFVLFLGSVICKSQAPCTLTLNIGNWCVYGRACSEDSLFSQCSLGV